MRVISVAHGPDADRWASLIGNHAAVRSSTSVHQALKTGAADVAIFPAAAFDVEQAVAALDSGLHLVLEPPADADPSALERIIEHAAATQRIVELVSDDTAISLGASAAGMLSKVGQVSHVSCIDRVAAPRAARGDSAGLASLARTAIAHIESMQRLFRARPVRLINRWAPLRASAACAAETFVELEGNVHVQYYGSEGGPHEQRRLWIEGTHGSLLVEGAFVWWRKKGWPKFVPVRWRPGAARSRSDATALRNALNAIGQQSSARHGTSGTMHPSSGSLRLLHSLMRAARDGVVVEIGGARA